MERRRARMVARAFGRSVRGNLMLKIMVGVAFAWLCAGCAGVADSASGPSAGTGSVTMYGVIDQGIEVRK